MRRLCAALAVICLAIAPAASAADLVERTPRPPRTPGYTTSSSTPAPSSSARPARASTAQAPTTSSSGDTGSARSHTLSQAPSTDTIALTLDDGYNPDPRILDLIDAWSLHGTAFLVGQVARSNPALVQRLVRAGWEVCSHTWSHKLLTTLSDAQIESEITKGADAVATVSGWRCPYFRPPFGAVNWRVMNVAARLGLRVVTWNASISDSTSPRTKPEVQVGIALATLQPGGILLGHFGAVHSFVVLRTVLATIAGRGWRTGTVSDLLGLTTTAPRPSVVAMAPVPVDTLDSPARAPVTRVPLGAWVGGFAFMGGLMLLAASTFALRRSRDLLEPAFEEMLVPAREPAVVGS